MKLRIEVAKLTPQQVVEELAVLRHELLRLDKNNLQSLNTVRQASAMIIELTGMVDELRELIPILDGENKKLTAMLERLTQEGAPQ